MRFDVAGERLAGPNSGYYPNKTEAYCRLGVRVEVAETLLGHSLPGMIPVYDRHAWEVEKRAAVEALAAELARIERVGEEFD